MDCSRGELASTITEDHWKKEDVACFLLSDLLFFVVAMGQWLAKTNNSPHAGTLNRCQFKQLCATTVAQCVQHSSNFTVTQNHSRCAEEDALFMSADRHVAHRNML